MLTKYKLIAIFLCCVGLQVLPLICVSEHQLAVRIVFLCLSFSLAAALCIKAPLASEISHYIALSSVFLNLTGFICLRAYQQSDQDYRDDYLDISQGEKDLELNLRFFFGFLNGICLTPGMVKMHQIASIAFGILLWSFQSRGVLSVLISVSFILEALVMMYLIHSEEKDILTAISTNSQKYFKEGDNSLQEQYEWIKEFLRKCAPLNLMILTDEMHVYYSTQHFHKIMGAEREEDIWNFLSNLRVEVNQNLFDQLKKKLESWRKETNKFGMTFTLKNIEIELEKYNLIIGECTVDNRRCLVVLLANSEDNISTFNQYTHKMINSISHDLKTPLNAIILLLDILKDQIKNRQVHQTPPLRMNHPITSPLGLKKAATLGRNTTSNSHVFASSHRISVRDQQFVDPFSQLGQKSVSLRLEQEDQIKAFDSAPDSHFSTSQTIKQDPFSAVSGVLIPLQEEDEEEEEQERTSFKNQATEEWLQQSFQKAASRNHLYHENTNLQSGQGMKSTPSQTMFAKNPSSSLIKMKSQRLSPSSNRKIKLQIDQIKANTHSQNIQSLVQIKEDEENSIQTQNSSLVLPPVIPHHSGLTSQPTHHAPPFKRNHRRHKSKSTPLNPQLQKSLSTDDKDLTPCEQAYQGEFDIMSPKVEPHDKDSQSVGERQALLGAKQTSILDLNKKSPTTSFTQEHLPVESSSTKKLKRKISVLNGLQHRQDQVINAIREQNDVKVLFSYISSIEKNGQLLESRINDLIDYSTLLGKKELSLTCTQFDLTDVLMEMDDLFGVQARQKKLLLFWPQINIKMKNDKPRIKQILINIIGNAIKFTFEGFIRISVDILESERQQLLEISVQDTGIGIPDHILSNMFSFTDHLRQVKDDHRQGVGIGLEICSRLCQIIGPSNQQVIVSSEINAGSKFSFSVFIDHPLYNEEHDLSSGVPKRRKKKAQRAPINTQISFRSENEYEDDRTNHISLPCFTTKKSLLSGEGLHEKLADKKKLSVNDHENKNYDEEHEDEEETILIVDDVAFNLIALRNTLKLIYPHLKVIEAQNGKQAVEKVRENNGFLDLVIMDINMPIMDGFQAMQIINDEIKDKTLEYVPIIAHTAFDNNDDKQKCFSLGAKGFLPKPVKRIELQRAIQPYLSEQAFQSH